MELINESLVCLAFLLLYVFTEWGPNEETKYFIGWFVVGIVFVMTVLNLFIVLKEIIRGLMLMTIKYYRRVKFAFLKRFAAFQKKK